jgi:hypothetical protein
VRSSTGIAIAARWDGTVGIWWAVRVHVVHASASEERQCVDFGKDQLGAIDRGLCRNPSAVGRNVPGDRGDRRDCTFANPLVAVIL